MRPLIKEMWVPSGLSNHPGRLMVSISKVTIHTTGNHNNNATAEAHARLQFNGGGGRQASWHYSVDEGEIWQSFRDEQMCWHTGTRLGNENSIGIEICVNSRKGFAAACEKAARLTAYLLSKHGLAIEDVAQHHCWSKKNCPAELRSAAWNISWDDFINMVSAHMGDVPTEIAALRSAGVSFDEVHWQGVFTGAIKPNKDWTKILTARIIDARWGQLSLDDLKLSFMSLLGKRIP